jgi:hypothetical protein
MLPGVAVVHHLDGNGRNNSPDNLTGLTHKQHRQLHPLRMRDYPRAVKALKERNRKRSTWEKLSTPEVRVKAVTTRRARGWNKRDRKENHVVVKVEAWGEHHVWDLTVDHDAHNFAIDDGVFVHNCYYNPSDKHSRTFKPQFVEQSNRVLCDRTITLKTMCHVIREHGLGMPVLDRQLQLLIQHCKALAPLQIEEDGDIYEVIDSTGDDHLAHCLGYAIIGFEQITKGWGNFSVSYAGE